MASAFEDHKTSMRLPSEVKDRILSFLCPYERILSGLRRCSAKLELERAADEERVQSQASVEPTGQLEPFPPAEVLADVRELVDLFAKVVELAYADVDLRIFPAAAGGEPVFQLLASGGDASDGLGNDDGAGGDEQPPLAKSALEAVSEQLTRRARLFMEAPGVCRQCTTVTFKLRKYDIYEASKRCGGRKLAIDSACGLNLIMYCDKAQAVSSAYRSKIMRSVVSICGSIMEACGATGQSEDPDVAS